MMTNIQTKYLCALTFVKTLRKTAMLAVLAAVIGVSQAGAETVFERALSDCDTYGEHITCVGPFPSGFTLGEIEDQTIINLEYTSQIHGWEEGEFSRETVIPEGAMLAVLGRIPSDIRVREGEELRTEEVPEAQWLASTMTMVITVEGRGDVDLIIGSSRFFEDPTNCGSLDRETTVEDHTLGRITLERFNVINDLIEIKRDSAFPPFTMLCSE